MHAGNGFNGEVLEQINPKPNEKEHMVLGLGHVQKSLHMFSIFVPIIDITKHFSLFRGREKKWHIRNRGKFYYDLNNG